MQQEPAAFKAFARDYFKDLDPSLFDAVFANNVGMYMKTPVPTQKHFDVNVEFLNMEYRGRRQPEVPASFKFANAFDLSFLEKGMQGL